MPTGWGDPSTRPTIDRAGVLALVLRLFPSVAPWLLGSFLVGQTWQKSGGGA